MQIRSELSAQTYLAEMRSRMGKCFQFDKERFTGIFVGNCFSVVHHCAWDPNRRINGEKNRAIGFVRRDPCGSGCEVCFIPLRGYSNPLSMLGVSALCWVVAWLMYGVKGQGIPVEVWDFGARGLSVVCPIIIAFSTAWETKHSDRGAYGREMVMALLHHPEHLVQELSSDE